MKKRGLVTQQFLSFMEARGIKASIGGRTISHVQDEWMWSNGQRIHAQPVHKVTWTKVGVA